MAEKTPQLSSVTNALRILKSYTYDNQVRRVCELSKELNLAKITVSRLISSLVAEDFLVPDEGSTGYRLGFTVLTLGGTLANTTELYTEVSPVLNDIVLQTNESAHVSILHGHDTLYLSKNSGPYYSNIKTHVGYHNPAYATSSGKVLLSERNPKEVDEMFDMGVKAFTKNTIIDPIQFHKELAKVRKQGYALSVEELSLGNYSLAVPVRNEDGEIVCSIAIIGPLSRLEKDKNKVDKFITVLKNAALDASERLGYES